MMNQLIERFMDQLEEAVEIGRNAKIQPAAKNISNVYVAGLGGSGIALRVFTITPTSTSGYGAAARGSPSA